MIAQRIPEKVCYVFGPRGPHNPDDVVISYDNERTNCFVAGSLGWTLTTLGRLSKGGYEIVFGRDPVGKERPLPVEVIRRIKAECATVTAR